MTEPLAPARNARRSLWVERAVLVAILLVAAALRVHGIGFGLPALNDPDEPLFMMTAVEMLRNQSLNPGWFGHPGTITLYSLALVMLGVAGLGLATGRFDGAEGFVAAVYADPAILFVPARGMIAACGVLCVLLTWRLGRRLGGPRVGLIAAAILAVNAVHVQYSQVIRTDIQASVFMLLGLLAALQIQRTGKLRAYLFAGLAVGLGVATKWPAAAIALSPGAAGLWRIGKGHRGIGRLALFGAVALATLIVASPYLLLDYQTVLQNLAGEARPAHPGQSGQGFLDNLGWYAANPLLHSLGAAGLALAAAGTILLAWRRPRVAIAILPGIAACAAILCFQALRWDRWVVPLLPFLAIAAAYALRLLSNLIRRRSGRRLRWLEPVAALLLGVPMLQATLADTHARLHDTRQIASDWLRAHAPPGSSVLVEHAALDLLHGGWRLKFPLGSAGCIDAHAALAGRIRYTQVERLRSDSPVIDLGHVDADQLESCRADYAIFTHYDRYAAQHRYASQLARYRALSRGGLVRAVIRPAEGLRAGPTVYIVELGPKR